MQHCVKRQKIEVTEKRHLQTKNVVPTKRRLPSYRLPLQKNYELRFELNCLFFLRKHYIRTPKMTLEKKSISGAKTNIRS